MPSRRKTVPGSINVLQAGTVKRGRIGFVFHRLFLLMLPGHAFKHNDCQDH